MTDEGCKNDTVIYSSVSVHDFPKVEFQASKLFTTELEPEIKFYNMSEEYDFISWDFDNGKISYKDLLNSNSKCLYITETIGHGSNIITGDYSVGATGFLVENGEFKYPINEITIAGNFKDMFRNITLADDLEFEYSTNSPTMMIEGMVVAGK